MSKKPSRAQRKEMRAKIAKARVVSEPQPPAPTTTPATSNSSAKLESAPTTPKQAPKQATARPAKRATPKAATKNVTPAAKEEPRDSTPPVTSTPKKTRNEHAILAFVALIAVAVGVAYFATRKPSPPLVPQDKLNATAEKTAEKPSEPPGAPAAAPPPPVVAPPATTTTIAPSDSADKPAPSP